MRPGARDEHPHDRQLNTAAPRCFFDIDDGRLPLSDSEGTECASLLAARAEAIQVLAQTMKDEMPERDSVEYRVAVRRAGGTPVYRVSISLLSEWLTLTD